MKKTLLSLCALIFLSMGYAQSLKDYIEKNDEKKIKKKIVVSALCEPVKKGVGYKSFSDGHGKNPYFTSKDQLPKKIALASFYVVDNGTRTTIHNISMTTHSLTAAGGNHFANQLLKTSFESMKEAFQQGGMDLIDIQQALDTKEKADFYKSFKPDASGVGKFLGIENFNKAEMVNTADYYRCFAAEASWDHIRAEAMGGELCKKLGVDAVLVVEIELSNSGKEVTIKRIKWGLNGPNPIPKEDKKYIGQKLGSGYYAGQVYFYSYFDFDKPPVIATLKKKELESEDYEGFGTLLKYHAEKTAESLNNSILE